MLSVQISDMKDCVRCRTWPFAGNVLHYTTNS